VTILKSLSFQYLDGGDGGSTLTLDTSKRGGFEIVWALNDPTKRS